MVRKTTLAASAVGLALAGAAGYAAYQSRSTPRVPYTILETRGNVEIRRYPEAVVAETTAPSEREAFGRLFRYITGANRSRRAGDEGMEDTSETIAMTAPVETSEAVAMTAPVETEADDAGTRMAFYLPAEYDFESAPEPTDPSVRLVEVPERVLAVRSFSWWSSDRRVAKFSDELHTALAERPGYTAVSDPILLRYDGPGTPPFLRTNEVAVEVRRTTATQTSDVESSD